MQQISDQFIETARLLLKEYGFFVAHLWHVDDIHFLCKQKNWPTLTHEEAKDVFLIFHELYDGEEGMSWPKLEIATQLYLAQAGRIHQMKQPRNLSADFIAQYIEE